MSIHVILGYGINLKFKQVIDYIKRNFRLEEYKDLIDKCHSNEDFTYTWTDYKKRLVEETNIHCLMEVFNRLHKDKQLTLVCYDHTHEKYDSHLFMGTITKQEFGEHRGNPMSISLALKSKVSIFLLREGLGYPKYHIIQDGCFCCS